nr:hypothetical protein [Candidatus Sigynarchaeota archaeon]
MKYVPDPGGTWTHRETGITYQRSYWHQGVEVLLNTESIAKKAAHGPLQSWLITDPVFNTVFLEVPTDQVRDYLFPEQRLASICDAGDGSLDPLERKVKHVITALSTEFKATGIKVTDFGITGSILWNGHSERSDININVYGKRTCTVLHDALVTRAREAPSLTSELMITMKGFHDVPFLARAPSLPSSVLSRKPKLKLAGFAPGIQIRWCLRRGEFPVTYGQEVYHDLGVEQFKLQVSSDEHALFYPAFVGVKTLEGPLDVRRIMIYDTRLTRFFKNNDIVQVNATVQEVKPTRGEKFFQLLIGSKAHAEDEKVSLLNTDSGR